MDAGATHPGVLLQTLAARAAITDVLHAYCRIFDANDLDALDEVFTDDCVVMFRPGADHERHGLDELRSYYASGASRIAACSHHLSNIEIQLHGDAAADSRAYFYAWHRYSPDHGGGGGETWGQYVDSLVRQPGGWRIVSRQFLVAGSTSTGQHFPTPRRPREVGGSGRYG
jgi:ketosteroid isomerase-like protein